MGDIVRAIIAGKSLKNKYPLAFSTVLIDRYLDVVCVGTIFALFFVSGYQNATIMDSAIFYMILAISILFVTSALYLFRKYLKKAARTVAGIFNNSIEAWLLEFAWALISNIKDIVRKISAGKFLLSTIGMWAMYLLSYFMYGEFLSSVGDNISWINVFSMLFTQNGIRMSTFATPMLESYPALSQPIYMAVYMLVPLVLLLLLATKMKPSGKDNNGHINLLPHINPKERLDFLELYFSGGNREYISNYLKINQNISIIRDYSAGSNATTMLCTDGHTTFFRKYAFGEDGKKLYQQVRWLKENAGLLKVPPILREDHNEIYCYYDMPFNSGATGMFEYVHSVPAEDGWRVIKMALENLETTIYRRNVRKTDVNTIHEYYNSKILKNIEKIKGSKRIGKLLEYDTIQINGVEYPNLQTYEKYLGEEKLQRIFCHDTYAVIHGDLTIENIICNCGVNGTLDYYFIDPNTGNIHDSPNLDYGKLLQSIHGGYEFLMATKNVECEGNKIQFMYTKSAIYNELHTKLHQYMTEHFSSERVRSIYFHEIIHWLRLMPYKIEKTGKRALIFYAGLLMVLKDIIEMYGDSIDEQ